MLITLGIIGIVAAMTIPILTAKHQKRVVETRIKKFYTTINQAVKLSEVENGEYQYWTYPEENDAEGIKNFYQKYFAKYLITTNVSNLNKMNTDNDGNPTGEIYNSIIVYFSDGSAMIMRSSGGIDISFKPIASKTDEKSTQRNSFSFNFNKINSTGNKAFIEPYSAGWDGTRENLINHARYGCRKKSPTYMYCTKLLQLDGWEIKDDYPW